MAIVGLVSPIWLAETTVEIIHAIAVGAAHPQGRTAETEAIRITVMIRMMMTPLSQMKDPCEVASQRQKLQAKMPTKVSCCVFCQDVFILSIWSRG